MCAKTGKTVNILLVLSLLFFSVLVELVLNRFRYGTV